MSGLLTHSPAEVVRALLVSLGLGADPAPGAAWPVYVDNEPAAPDDCLTVYDAEGTNDGYDERSGDRQEHYGFQVRVRGRDFPTAHAKARAVAVGLDREGWGGVSVDGADYCLGPVARTSGVARLGKDASSRRQLMTVNGVVTIQQAS